MDTRSSAVVALKPLLFAKSRVHDVAAPLRRQLAWSMALDTLRALAGVVDHVLVVSRQPALQATLRRHGLDLEVVAEEVSSGLNPALRQGTDELRRRGFETVLACVGDLPALSPSSLRRILAAASPDQRSFVADASGVGTTMLIVTSGPLDPRFQGRSAAAHHASGARSLTDDDLGGPIADARRDVDTEVDLAAAYGLGLGPATSALMDPLRGSLGDYASITVGGYLDTAEVTQGWEVITASGYRRVLAARMAQDHFLSLRPGQRLHAAVAGEQVLSVWL